PHERASRWIQRVLLDLAGPEGPGLLRTTSSRSAAAVGEVSLGTGCGAAATDQGRQRDGEDEIRMTPAEAPDPALHAPDSTPKMSARGGRTTQGAGGGGRPSKCGD